MRHVWREVGSASRFRRSKKVAQQDLALQALEKGEISALRVFRLDRWTRRGAGAVLSIIEPQDGRPRRLLVDNGDPETPGIGLDSANPRDRSELIRRAEDAREETEILSERVRNTKTFQRDNGEWLNGLAPYGIRIVMVTAEGEDGEQIEERKLERDTETSAGTPGEPTVTKLEIARWVTYEAPVAGHAKREISRMLNDRGVPSPAGGTWAFSTVANMIDNPAYAGWQVTGREDGKSKRMLYRNAAGERVSVMVGSPVLTEAEYNAAQAASRGTGPAVDKESWRARHVLTDLLECAGCGSSATWRGKGYCCWRPGAGECVRPRRTWRRKALRNTSTCAGLLDWQRLSPMIACWRLWRSAGKPDRTLKRQRMRQPRGRLWQTQKQPSAACGKTGALDSMTAPQSDSLPRR